MWKRNFNADTAKEIIKLLAPKLGPTRMDRLTSVRDSRRDCVRVVLENVWDPGNSNAVLRTIEAFGLHQVHVVDTVEPFVHSDYNYARWLNIQNDGLVEQQIEGLKQEGFTVLATTLSPSAVDIRQVDLTNRKVAVIFGNENRGISKHAAKNADQHVIIPMTGFTQSLNISVAVACTLTHLLSHTQHLQPVPVAPPAPTYNIHAQDKPHYTVEHIPVESVSDVASAGLVEESPLYSPVTRSTLWVTPYETRFPNAYTGSYRSPSFRSDEATPTSAESQVPKVFRSPFNTNIQHATDYSVPSLPDVAPVTVGPLSISPTPLPCPALNPAPLSNDERTILFAKWLMKSVKDGNMVLRDSGSKFDWI